MKSTLLVRLVTVMVCVIVLDGARATPPSPSPSPQEAIRALLLEFLARNDEPAEHDRFWADDLVYTGSSGRVATKPEIMKSVSSPSSGPRDTYAAEDILVRLYGTTAALTFRLVRHTPEGKTELYRNSGTLLLRNGSWQVVTWQATRVASAESAPSK